mgnify:CR=1 FL=1
MSKKEQEDFADKLTAYSPFKLQVPSALRMKKSVERIEKKNEVVSTTPPLEELQDDESISHYQEIAVRFSDGRTGYFTGPAVLSEDEMKLGIKVSDVKIGIPKSISELDEL